MTVTNTKVEVCNSALVMVGGDVITSFDDTTREAEVCKAFYENSLRYTLQLYHWRFSIKQATLNKVANPDSRYRYKYVYQLPSDYLQLVGREVCSYDYDIYEDKIYTDAQTLNISYQYRVSEGYFPSYFVEVLIYELAKKFSAALAQDETKVALYERLKNSVLTQARGIDARSAGSKGIPRSKFSLLNSRL